MNPWNKFRQRESLTRQRLHSKGKVGEFGLGDLAVITCTAPALNGCMGIAIIIDAIVTMKWLKLMTCSLLFLLIITREMMT